ncbi:MAG: hypothetical protein J3R72DRAFT_505560 [Linnemannia gamsii]|nr:MAG: hypothetical protein J3R72DRAFT_505560 [Linnemannia gamsii]
MDSRNTGNNYNYNNTGQKHPRDPWDGLDGVPPKTPRNASPTPMVVSTENIDRPSMIQSGGTLPNPFQDDNADDLEEDDEQLDAVEKDENNGHDLLLPDKVEQESNSVGELNGLDLAPGFESFLPSPNETSRTCRLLRARASIPGRQDSKQLGPEVMTGPESFVKRRKARPMSAGWRE